VLGGVLIQFFGWRSILAPVLVMGVFVFPFVRKKIPSLPGFAQPDYLRQFDWGGVILLGAAITSLLLYASSRPITGVAALRDWRLLAVTVFLFSAFIIWEQRQAKPFVPLKIYANITFTLTSLVAGIRMFSMAGIRFIVPLYLAEIHGVSAGIIGIILTAHAVPLFSMIRVGGQLADKWGSRRLVVYSLLIQTTAMIYLAFLPETASLWWIVGGVMWQSFGAAFSLAPLHKSSMAGISEEQTGIAAGLYSMVRFAGVVFGVALCGVVLQQGLSQVAEPIDAYKVTFWFVAGVIMLGALLGSRLKD